MNERSHRPRPEPWPDYKAQLRSRHLLLFYRVEWCLHWVSWALGNWALLDVLDHLGTFSLLIAVIFYFADSGNRVKQRHYQAWQVINSAQGKGGNGGRIEALQELSADHVPLVGVDADSAFLQGIRLPAARLSRCDLHASDLRNSSFARATLSFCNLHSANFRSADMSRAALDNVDLADSDLTGADLHGADLTGTDLSNADLHQANLASIVWKGITAMHCANITGVRGASPEFLAFAMAHGAISSNTSSAAQQAACDTQ